MYKQQARPSEQQRTAAQYITNFYNYVESLNHQESTLWVIKRRILKGDVEDEEKNALSQTIDEYKYHARQCFNRYSSLVKRLKRKGAEDKTVEAEATLTKIGEATIPKEEDITKYTQFMNDFLSSEIMTSLLETSQDVLDMLYETTEEPPAS